MLNLDTHILIDFIRGKLLEHELKEITKHQNELIIADIVLWEVAMLRAKKRIHIQLDSQKFQKVLSYLTVIPISLEIAEMSVGLDFNADPADRLIAATSIIHKTKLLTRDKKILKSKMVQFV